MFWSKGRARSLFFGGAMLAFIGLGIHQMGYVLPGALSLCIGIAMVVIGMSVLRMMLLLEMKGIKPGDADQDK